MSGRSNRNSVTKSRRSNDHEKDKEKKVKDTEDVEESRNKKRNTKGNGIEERKRR